jgi:predicted neuraminidase
MPAPTGFPNPNSGLDVLKLRNGDLLLAYNDSPAKRTPLCLAIAPNAEQWQYKVTIEQGHGEFSYPTLLQTDNDLIHLVYTYNRKYIQYSCFSSEWLMERKVTIELQG